MSTTTSTTSCHVRRHVYLVIVAHPDDECMFFAPTILSLTSTSRNANCNVDQDDGSNNNNDVWVLSLSNGNYDGMGRVREKELPKACRILGIDVAARKCICYDATSNDQLNDDPRGRWPPEAVATAIESTLGQYVFPETNDSDSYDDTASSYSLTIVTFDDGGVSGHVNHVDTYRGVQHWLSSTRVAKAQGQGRPQQEQHKNVVLSTIDAWKLVTVANPLLKYVPLLWIPMVLWEQWWYCNNQYYGGRPQNDDDNNASSSSLRRRSRPRRGFPPVDLAALFCVCTALQPIRVYWAMAAHASQWKWYRKLSVIFSRYTYCNTYRRIEIEGRADATRRPEEQE